MSPAYNSGKDFGFRWRSEQIKFRTHWSRNFIPTAVSTGSLSHPMQHWIGWWSLDCCKIHLEETAPLLNSSQPKSNTWLLRTRSRYTTEKSMDSKCNWCRMAQRRISWQSWRTWQHTKRNRSYKKQNGYELKRSERENRQPTKATRKENTTEKCWDIHGKSLDLGAIWSFTLASQTNAKLPLCDVDEDYHFPVYS